MPIDYKREYGRYKNYYLLKIQKISKEPIAQTSFVLVASLLTVAFFGIFAIKPTFTTIATLLKQIKDKREINQKLQAKITALQKAETLYVQITPKLGKINNTLPKNPEFSKLEQEIEYLTYKHNLILVSGSFTGFTVVGEKTQEEQDQKAKIKESSEEGGTTYTLSFNLVIGGNYNGLKNFLKDLENLDRLVVIETINLSKETNIKGVSLQMALKAKAFYLKPPKV